MKKNKNIFSNDANFHVSLKLVFKDKDERILILKMPENSSMAGFYDLPGGRIKKEEKESPFLEIIKREIHEELGNKIIYKIFETPVAIGRHTYISKLTNKKQYIFWVLFEGRLDGGKIILSNEHEDYDWVNLNKKNYKKYFIKGPLEGMTNYLTHKLL